jgi:hypothetical protein
MDGLVGIMHKEALLWVHKAETSVFAFVAYQSSTLVPFSAHNHLCRKRGCSRTSLIIRLPIILRT